MRVPASGAAVAFAIFCVPESGLPREVVGGVVRSFPVTVRHLRAWKGWNPVKGNANEPVQGATGSTTVVFAQHNPQISVFSTITFLLSPCVGEMARDATPETPERRHLVGCCARSRPPFFMLLHRNPR